MNYITLLNEEEIDRLCAIITGKAFKTIFQMQSKEFARIKPGFRPNKISDDEAMTIARKNISTPFVSSYINFEVDNWLKQIQTHIEIEMARGLSEDYALADTLVESYFRDEIKLYFKLAEKNIENSYLEKIQKLVDKRKRAVETGDAAEDEKAIFAAEEVALLKKELDACNQQLQSTEDAFELQLQQLRKELDSKDKELIDTQQRLYSLQCEKQEIETELNNIKLQVQNDDSEEVFTSFDGTDYDHYSLCEVVSADSTGKRSLTRMADIGKNGDMAVFNVNEYEPKTFDNRIRLFTMDGPTEPGTIGIWNWSAVPNEADQSRDYIVSVYNPEVKPIQVITFHDCRTVEELLEKLKSGAEAECITSRTIFSVYLSKGQYIGFLCRKQDMEQADKKIKLSKNVISLPRYDFNGKSIIRMINGKAFYRSMKIGAPSAVVYVKDPMDIVRTIILSRNTWQVFKQKGKSRSEWKIVREFLENIDTTTAVEDIVETINCSSQEAKRMIDDFVRHASSYCDGTTIEDSVLEASIYGSQELMERCKVLITDTWQEENQTVINEANEKIEGIRKQIEQAREELAKEYEDGRVRIQRQEAEADEKLSAIKTEHDSLEASLKDLEDRIAAHEQLATDVEAAVTRRIHQAQNDAAEFVAGLAFAPQVTVTMPEAGTSHTIDTVEVKAISTEEISYTPGTYLNQEDLEESDCWEKVLEIITDEFLEAGVIPKWAKPLAAFMYTAFLSHSPLLMVGPNASAIVDAFSGAIFGKTAGMLECSSQYNANSVKTCLSSRDDIVKIINPFSVNWIARIPEIIGNSKYCIAVYPYSEDIQIEPQSLYNYMLPIFTELLVEKAPAGRVIGGRLTSGYKGFSLTKATKIHAKILSDMHTSLLVRTRIQTLLYNMHIMIKNQSADYDVVFALFPFAFATRQMPLLLEAIRDGEKPKIPISKDVLEMVLGMYGDHE